MMKFKRKCPCARIHISSRVTHKGAGNIMDRVILWLLVFSVIR